MIVGDRKAERKGRDTMADEKKAPAKKLDADEQAAVDAASGGPAEGTVAAEQIDPATGEPAEVDSEGRPSTHDGYEPDEK
jgi:hypothetical protein